MMLQTKCGVRQSWATCFFLVHLDAWDLVCLNLDYDKMAWACTWKAWTLIMILGICLNDLGLHLEGMHLVSFWPLMLIMSIHLWWAQVLGLDSFKKQFSVSIQSRVQSHAFGLEFIHSIQGSNNYDGLKCWTWAYHASNNSQTHA